MRKRWVIGVALSFIITTVIAEGDVQERVGKDADQDCKTWVFVMPWLCESAVERQEAERLRRERGREALLECCLVRENKDGTLKILTCPKVCSPRNPE